MTGIIKEVTIGDCRLILGATVPCDGVDNVQRVSLFEGFLFYYRLCSHFCGEQFREALISYRYAPPSPRGVLGLGDFHHVPLMSRLCTRLHREISRPCSVGVLPHAFFVFRFLCTRNSKQVHAAETLKVRGELSRSHTRKSISGLAAYGRYALNNAERLTFRIFARSNQRLPLSGYFVRYM